MQSRIIRYTFFDAGAVPAISTSLGTKIKITLSNGGLFFGDEFYSFNTGSANLIKLHDRFLDFFDRITEDSPEKVDIFITKLSGGIHTKHFIDILKAEGFIF